MPKPEKPIIFMKPTSSYIEEGQGITVSWTWIVTAIFITIKCFCFSKLPKGFKVNEEIELGVVMGKTCKNVSTQEALDYVAGYCVALDLTAISELVIWNNREIWNYKN